MYFNSIHYTQAIFIRPSILMQSPSNTFPISIQHTPHIFQFYPFHTNNPHQTIYPYEILTQHLSNLHPIHAYILSNLHQTSRSHLTHFDSNHPIFSPNPSTTILQLFSISYPTLRPTSTITIQHTTNTSIPDRINQNGSKAPRLRQLGHRRRSLACPHSKRAAKRTDSNANTHTHTAALAQDDQIDVPIEKRLPTITAMHSIAGCTSLFVRIVSHY